MTKISRIMVYFQPKIVNYLWVLSHFVTVCLELSLNIKVLFTLLFLPLYHSLLRSLENSRVKHVSQFSDETWRKVTDRVEVSMLNNSTKKNCVPNLDDHWCNGQLTFFFLLLFLLIHLPPQWICTQSKSHELCLQNFYSNWR